QNFLKILDSGSRFALYTMRCRASLARNDDFLYFSRVLQEPPIAIYFQGRKKVEKRILRSHSKTAITFRDQEISMVLPRFCPGFVLGEVSQMGLVLLVAISYMALYISPVEKTFLFVLVNGMVIAGCLAIRRSIR
ncbi:MAG: hypothetical protein QME78_12380, partial [Thermodesulfobacteriota bacterium]|nr:hypothetical protein [Thermodesulfobacteriota bacterium]